MPKSCHYFSVLPDHKFEVNINSSLIKIHLATCYQVFAIKPPTIYVQEPSLTVLIERGCVKSLVSNRRWSDNIFINGSNYHLTSQYQIFF
ncbi:hypothetical protein MTR_8g020680 [Medicago truncatula]|uniref:Uncharacterized protein n=1 Tax=Medicago truncatula TaxID=3880 RepID=G7L6V3_MEDTR|nr:hypothetical protein MTR_8g020680 [Medicago truncatula]